MNSHEVITHNIFIRPSVRKDVDDLFWRLRKSDTQEIYDSHHAFPKDALKDGFSHSLLCYSIVKDEQVIGMGGIRCDTLLGEKAVIWLLASPELDKCKTFFLRNSLKYVDMFLEMYPCLENYVSADNKKSIQWLRWCGASIDDPIKYGMENKLFRHFSFSRKE